LDEIVREFLVERSESLDQFWAVPVASRRGDDD
jgi:hypothetical protein